MAEQPGISMDQVFALLAKMDENQQKNLMAFAAELAKGSPEDQAERERKRIGDLKRAQEAVQLAQAEEQGRENRKRGCPHATTHPGTGVTKHTWRAQVHAPANQKPYFVPTCMQCWTQGPKIAALPDMLTNGVNLDQYVSLNLDVIEQWSKLQPAV